MNWAQVLKLQNISNTIFLKALKVDFKICRF